MSLQIKKTVLILAAAASISITPSLSFGQDIWEQPTLSSDYTGSNSWLAQHGVQVNQSITQFYGGVVAGGRDEDDYYSGRWDLLTNLDGSKAGLWDGFFVKMRVGANWDPIDRFNAGSIVAPYLPATMSKTDQESIAITDLSFTQMFSPNIGITLGKFDIVDTDFNSFAHGRGLSQFFNTALTLNPLPIFLPFSSLGAGVFALYDDGSPLASFTVLDTHNVPTESGFDDLFSDGVVMSVNGELPSKFGGLNGRHRFGFAVSTADRATLNQDPRFIIENAQLQTESDTWAVVYNGEQYLFSDPNDPKKGWGLFARAALSDPDKNILHFFLSAGIGGNGIIPCRPDDQFGLGWYHADVSDTPILDRVAPLSNEEGVELFYDAAIIPWIRLAADIQYIHGALKSADDALMISGRLRFLL